MIVTANSDQGLKKVTDKPVKRNVAPSASNVLEDVFDFILDTAPDAFPSTEIDNLYQLMGDLTALDKIEMNEARHFTHKSTSIARTIARKFYKANAPRIKAMQAKLRKNKAAGKKKEIMSKSDRAPVTKKKKKKYPGTKSHSINEKKLRAGCKAAVEKLFAPKKFRVIKPFTLSDGKIDAALYEQILYKFGCYTLIKRSGEKMLFKCEKEDIKDFIKLESEGITLEDMDV
jgi:hypothetical protein